MLKFESKHTVFADEYVVTVRSDDGSDSAMLAVFATSEPAYELAAFFNFLAQGFARYQIEHAQPDTSPSKA